MLESEFADILPFLAAGFTGSGSEHYGYDDEISRITTLSRVSAFFCREKMS